MSNDDLMKAARKVLSNKGKAKIENVKNSGKAVNINGIDSIISAIRKKFEKPKEGEEEIKEIDKIDIPGVSRSSTFEKEEEIDLSSVDTYYPLIPKRPKPGDDIFSYARIYWDDQENGLVYKVVEPEITQEDRELLESLKETIQEKLDVDFNKLRKVEAKGYLDDKINEALSFMKESLPKRKNKSIKYYIMRDFIGYGKVEPLMKDPNIEDISCDGLNIPIYVFHRNPQFGSIGTNIQFENAKELDSFVMRLAQKAGRSISVASPLVDASLPDGSRLQATLATDIARRGSNFTVRKFTEKPLTPVDFINLGSIDSRMLAYFWLSIEHGKSVLISGGTATGKTSLLNVLSLFIPPEMKIVSIEDTPELRLTHNHWVPEVSRTSISGPENSGKEVDLYNLLRESLRQRPDYIIVGEVRGRETYVLFQQIATGHPGLSTIHAENLNKLLDRLTTKPINLSPNLIENLDLIIFLSKVKEQEGYVRRTSQVLEVEKYDREKQKPMVNQIFQWNPKNRKFEPTAGSILMKKISDERGIDAKELKDEIIDRAKVIEWMKSESITDYRQVSRVIKSYYNNKEDLMDYIDVEEGI
ncbi:MAG: type II/IV secretion system ATPase subunit [Candidatus Aenigmatarchaeota archaeon]